jgi:hypothetical protein
MSTLHEEKSLWDTGVPALKGWKAKWGSWASISPGCWGSSSDIIPSPQVNLCTSLQALTTVLPAKGLQARWKSPQQKEILVEARGAWEQMAPRPRESCGEGTTLQPLPSVTSGAWSRSGVLWRP